MIVARKHDDSAPKASVLSGWSPGADGHPMVLACHAVVIGYPSGTGNDLKMTLEFVSQLLGIENELMNNLVGEGRLSKLFQEVSRRESEGAAKTK